MSPLERGILGRFSSEIRKADGDRLVGIYAFDYLFEDGHEDEVSVDIDVAVVQADGDWTFIDEKRRLVEFTFNVLIENEVYIRAWPLPASARRDPATYANPDPVRGIKRHSEPVMEAV
jgi:hypothetical protein